MSDDSISEAEYEFYYSLENDGEMSTVINKNLLKKILSDITKLAGTTSVNTECGGDFERGECMPRTCKYFDMCAQQRAKCSQTMNILQKITRL